MPSTPTSKAQVQAYKFVLRRMQSALIRRDPVMLHDPMRTHTRAMVVGAALAAVALAGFAVYGLLSPSPQLPGGDNQIVLSKESGQLYVLSKTQDGKRLLTPTFNLASARLLIMARAQQNQQGGGGAQSGQSGQSAASATPPPAAQEVDDSQLSGVAVSRLTGIPDGPSILPSGANQQAAGTWAICDDYQRDADLNNPTAGNQFSTTVMSGVTNLGNSLTPDAGFLVREKQTGKTFLIYRTPTTANKPESDVVRAEVNLDEPAIRATFGNDPGSIRLISSGLLNAIPAVQGLTPPAISDTNSPGPPGLPAEVDKVGSVFQVATASGTSYYVVLKNGIQDITESASVATVLEFQVKQQANAVPPLAANQILNVPRVNQVDVGQFPKQVPTTLKASTFPTVCLGWNPNTSDPVNKKEHTVLTVGTALPIPKSTQPVPVGSPNADGEKINGFYMPAGKAAFIHSAQSPAQFDNGPLYLVSDRGIRYGIPDNATAAGLGLSNAAPAPESIVRLLAPGSDLSTKAVLRTFDALEVPGNEGQYPSSSAPDSGAAGSGNGG